MDNKTSSKQGFILKLVVFLMLFLSAGFVVVNDLISSFMTISLWLFVFFLVLINNRKIDIKNLLVTISCASFIFISTLLNGDVIINSFYVVFALMVSFFAVNKYSFDAFSNAFIDVLRFLSIVSLIGYFSYIVFPSLSHLAVITNSAGNPFSNLYIFVHSCNTDSSSYYRNWGMFWEPGAYQVFLSLACFFELRKKNRNFYTIVLFVITIVTTFSTTGYLSLAILLMITLLEKNKDMQNNKLKIGLSVFLVTFLVFVYFNQNLFLSTSNYSVFGKLLNFFNGDFANRKVTSTTIRYNAIFEPIKIFLQNPIFGVGQLRLRNMTYDLTLGMNTCTMVNWFAFYGIFYGLIMLFGYFSLSRSQTSSFLMALLVFVFFFAITMSENMANNSVLFLLALYGYNNLRVKV